MSKLKNRAAITTLVMLALLACAPFTTLGDLTTALTPAPQEPTEQPTSLAAKPAATAPRPPSPPSPAPTLEWIATMPGASGLDVPLTVRETAGVARTLEPVTSGVPIPRRANLIDLARLRLLDANGKPVPAQFTPLARWGGAPGEATQPVRWLLLDFQASMPANGLAQYRLVDSGGPLPGLPAFSVTESANAIVVSTGAAQFSISKSDGRLTAPNLASAMYGQAVDSRGAIFTTTGPVTATVAMQGPLRASIQVQGAYRDAGGKALLHYTSRYWFYAGQPSVRLFHTVENNNLCPLGEYEQLACFDIGSGGSVTFGDLSLVLPTSLRGAVNYKVGGEGAPVAGALTADLALYQDSSGTESWNRYPTLKDWEGKPLDTRPRMQSYVTFRGYRILSGKTTLKEGNQAAGWLSVAGQNVGWTIGVRDFWQNFPKALRASPNGTLQIGLFPDEFGPREYGFALRAGEHKTHEVLFAPAEEPGLTGEPLFAQAPAKWYVDSGAFGWTALPNPHDWPDHEQYVQSLLTTSPTHRLDDYSKNLPEALAHSDFYGIFDYGDWMIDYEGFEVAPLNLKYDNDLGMWLQWARTGDPRWFALAEAADRHAADIDILHNRHTPRHWGDGIAFGHSEHDEAGFANPHRNRNSGSPDTAFGVPGMLVAYYLTGYEKGRDSAVELADAIEYRLRNDEHLCAFFADCSGEGYVLYDGLYDVGARPAANSLYVAVAAYRATGEQRYLAVADAVVAWAQPAAQPFMTCPRTSGDERSMRPWTLNLYLRALAAYVDVRSEFGLPDAGNARSSYLAYANWLRSCPWLDLPSIETGRRAAYSYEWWFDGRKGLPGDDDDNADASVNNWLLLGADAMAYAYRLGGDADYMERAARLFRAGSRDPWYAGDANHYAESKEAINSLVFGHTFLNLWSQR